MTIDEIQQKLLDNFPEAEIELHNTSSMHRGHNARGYHLKTIIKYKEFEGKTLIEQHRMVQEALKEELGGIIHALSIKTMTK